MGRDPQLNIIIIILFVLNSTRNTYNTQYNVEQDIKAWSTYRWLKLSLTIETFKKSLDNATVRQVRHISP